MMYEFEVPWPVAAVAALVIVACTEGGPDTSAPPGPSGPQTTTEPPAPSLVVHRIEEHCGPNGENVVFPVVPELFTVRLCAYDRPRQRECWAGVEWLQTDAGINVGCGLDDTVVLTWVQ